MFARNTSEVYFRHFTMERISLMKRQNSERAGKPLKRGESRTTITMDSYMPTIISEKRMKIEDLCR